MGRPEGSRNRDYDTKRHALAAALAPVALRADGEPATLRDMAHAAGVSPPTLVHYFGSRDGAFVAAMEASRIDATRYLEGAADPAGRPPEQTLPAVLLGTIEAWRAHDLGRVVTGGLALGLGHDARGPAFTSGVLEPFLVAVESLLLAHVVLGELPEHDARAVALTLLAPLVLALLHQDALGGDDLRPLDVPGLARANAALVLAGLRARGAAADPPG